MAAESPAERAERARREAKAERVLAEGWALLNAIEDDPRYKWSGIEVLTACAAMAQAGDRPADGGVLLESELDIVQRDEDEGE